MFGAIRALAGASILDLDIRAYMPLILIFLILGIIFLLFRIFHVSTKLLWGLLFNGLIGVAMLFFFDFILDTFMGMSFFHIDVNWVSAVIAGTLGVPGVLLLLVLKWAV